MALALCAHPRPALRACEEERPRTDAPGTQRNETTALAPPSGLPDRRLPARSQLVVCVPPTVPFGTSSIPKRPRSHSLVTSRGYIAAGIAGGPFKGRSGRSGLPRHQGCSRAGALVRRPGPAPPLASRLLSPIAPRVTSSPNWPFERWWWTPLPMGPLLLLHGTARGLLRRPEGRARLLGSAQDTSVTRPLRPLHGRYVRYMSVTWPLSTGRDRGGGRHARPGGVRGRLWRGRDTTHARNAAAGVLYCPRSVRGGSVWPCIHPSALREAKYGPLSPKWDAHRATSDRFGLTGVH